VSSTAGACGVTFLSYLSKLDVVLVIVILIRPKGTPLRRRQNPYLSTVVTPTYEGRRAQDL